MSKNDALVAHLRDPHTIRSQAKALLTLAKADKLEYFALEPARMSTTASFVIEVIKEQYPDLDIPYHSRWRHFEAGGVDRIQNMRASLAHVSAEELGKILYELVIISVFMDAGAGQTWRYKEEATGKEYSRSEGLALASLAMYQKGLFSAHPETPLRVDAARLIAFSKEDLLSCFQVTPANSLEGIDGRLNLLNQLGQALLQNSAYFGREGRLGHFYTHVASLAKNNRLPAATLFQNVLEAFNKVWPVRLLLNGISLGDVWQHKALHSSTAGSEYVPFHKLSQWLTYSLIEPLEQAGIQVTGLETLTGLPEYRNGGLLIDTGVLRVKNPEMLEKAYAPGAEIIVEWRALTLALLDELADLIRDKLGKNADELPLAKILQGGTWEAGRRIAREKRAQGTPPIQIISDGTVF